MFEFLIYSTLYICYVYGRVHQQTVGIPMGTNCVQEKRKKLSRFFNFTFRYLDEILKLNDSKFDYFVGRICKVRVGSERNFTTKEMIAIFAFGNLLYVCSNIPVAPAYTVYIFQLIR